ncbi:cyclic AMP-dependent transcription factor ATF-3-like [Saccoglossus kowalevskii]|uniref:Jun dimerization protein 2-like n=1 Tax=Saccoglossus kowalevskii TaxID=10224 RepID=A0ABM0MXU4_SACKO|nr:PREDICTED: jun dimerization protein 2-like [Saccoglossus kowalevskii]
MDEEKRISERRQRNRIAATKCRNKKKDRMEFLMKEIRRLTEMNGELQEQVRRLRGEEEQLQIIWNFHVIECRKHIQDGPVNLSVRRNADVL